MWVNITTLAGNSLPLSFFLGWLCSHANQSYCPTSPPCALCVCLLGTLLPFFFFSGRVPQRLPLIYWGFFTTCQILAFQSWVFVLVDHRRFWFPRGEVPGLPISDSMLETLLFQVKWAMETVDFGPEDALGQGWDSSQLLLLCWGGVLLVCFGKGPSVLLVWDLRKFGFICV